MNMPVPRPEELHVTLCEALERLRAAVAGIQRLPHGARFAAEPDSAYELAGLRAAAEPCVILPKPEPRLVAGGCWPLLEPDRHGDPPFDGIDDALTAAHLATTLENCIRWVDMVDRALSSRVGTS